MDATSLLISAAFLFLIRPPARHTDTRAHPWTQFVEGLRYVRGDPVTVTTVIVASLLFFGYSGATFVGLPVLAKGPLGAGPVVLGRVMAIMLFGIFGLYPVSSGRAGWVSEAIGVR